MYLCSASNTGTMPVLEFISAAVSNFKCKDSIRTLQLLQIVNTVISAEILLQRKKHRPWLTALKICFSVPKSDWNQNSFELSVPDHHHQIILHPISTKHTKGLCAHETSQETIYTLPNTRIINTALVGSDETI